MTAFEGYRLRKLQQLFLSRLLRFVDSETLEPQLSLSRSSLSNTSHQPSSNFTARSGACTVSVPTAYVQYKMLYILQIFILSRNGP